jgi:NAD(P)-dependent dehydrogenase (short-subunit alcohol dehydrogenase family)
MFNKFSLAGKTALITGAAGLLGAEHSRALLESDARVVITDINDEKLEILKKILESEFPDKEIIACNLNVASSEHIQEVKRMLDDHNIGVDILINNAAIDPKVVADSGHALLSRFEDLTVDKLVNEVFVGLFGSIFCCQIFGTAMASRGGGVIVNIASDLSVIAPDQRLYKKDGLADELQSVKPVTYSIIKFGQIGLTKYLSTYWGDKGVRVNALSPGGVLNDQNESFIKNISALIPMGRMANKSEYRSALQFLCSDASSYMTGQNIVIDGGRSVW